MTQPPPRFPQGRYTQAPYPQAQFPQSQFPQAPYPQAPYPATVGRREKRGSIGDRGPWWVQTLVSAGIGLVLFIISVTLTQLPTSRWVSYGLWALVFVLYAVVIAVWARGGWRHLVAPLVAVAFLGLQRLLMLPFYIDWDWTYGSGWFYDVAMWVLPAAYYSGVIFGWSVARRRTSFALSGIVPVIGWIAFWVWFKQDHLLYDSGTLQETVLIEAVDAAMIVLGILIIWGCDAIGMAVRKPPALATPPMQPIPPNQFPPPPSPTWPNPSGPGPQRQ